MSIGIGVNRGDDILPMIFSILLGGNSRGGHNEEQQYKKQKIGCFSHISVVPAYTNLLHSDSIHNLNEERARQASSLDPACPYANSLG